MESPSPALLLGLSLLMTLLHLAVYSLRKHKNPPRLTRDELVRARTWLRRILLAVAVLTWVPLPLVAASAQARLSTVLFAAAFLIAPVSGVMLGARALATRHYDRLLADAARPS